MGLFLENNHKLEEKRKETDMGKPNKFQKHIPLIGVTLTTNDSAAVTLEKCFYASSAAEKCSGIGGSTKSCVLIGQVKEGPLKIGGKITIHDPKQEVNITDHIAFLECNKQPIKEAEAGCSVGICLRDHSLAELCQELAKTK
jgi:hypothetical protein